MHFFLTFLLAAIAFAWLVTGIQATLGFRRLPRMAQTAPLAAADCPSVSIIFAARDEAELLPAALETLLAQDCPRLEIIAVDDRSRDATPRILDDFAARHANLKIVHVRELPPDWLGKPHALQKGYEASSGEWLIFTDADVHFGPELVRRALAAAIARRWDHLTLLGKVNSYGFWETVVKLGFGAAIGLGVRPWNASNPRSRTYVGIGAFQLVRRDVYERCGTHARLHMEVIDDMKLGKIVKRGGFRSGVGVAVDFIHLRWHAGARNVIRGTEKNFFAAVGFSLPRTLGAVLGLFLMSVLPFLALPFTSGWAQIFAAMAAALAIISHAHAAYELDAPLLYALTQPLGALAFCYMLLRSAFITLRQGGVTWRGTFHPLDDLRKGMV